MRNSQWTAIDYNNPEIWPEAGRGILIRARGAHAKAGGCTEREIYCLWMKENGKPKFRNQNTLDRLSDSKVVLAWCDDCPNFLPDPVKDYYMYCTKLGVSLMYYDEPIAECLMEEGL